jgi:hypothetical protein
MTRKLKLNDKLNVNQVAKLCKVSRQAVYKWLWLEKGGLKYSQHRAKDPFIKTRAIALVSVYDLREFLGKRFEEVTGLKL